MNNCKYSPDEILQILNDFYNCQSVFDPEVDPGETLTFDTTISEWISICDLLGPKELAKSYHNSFQLNTPSADLELILTQGENKLRSFCNYLAEHAVKQSISPIIIMGRPCMSASIFKTLTANLQAKGVEAKNIRPSSKIAPLFRKHGPVLLEEVNKLAPGSLSNFKYSDNRIVKIGAAFYMFFFFTIIFVPVIWHFHWMLLIPLCIGVSLTFIGNKFSPAKEVIGGYDTVRDLILGMEAQSKKAV
jgi:hypothetical protein